MRERFRPPYPNDACEPSNPPKHPRRTIAQSHGSETADTASCRSLLLEVQSGNTNCQVHACLALNA